MKGYCSTGQSPQWAVVPVEEVVVWVGVGALQSCIVHVFLPVLLCVEL